MPARCHLREECRVCETNELEGRGTDILNDIANDRVQRERRTRRSVMRDGR